MALKNYEWNGMTWQFEEGTQPASAKPVDAPAPIAKRGPAPANKARKAPKQKGSRPC